MAEQTDGGWGLSPDVGAPGSTRAQSPAAPLPHLVWCTGATCSSGWSAMYTWGTRAVSAAALGEWTGHDFTSVGKDRI